MANPIQEKTSAGPDGCLGLIVRLYWIAFGNFPLIFLPIQIYLKKLSGLSIYDLFFLLTYVSLVAVRYVDIVYFKGTTADSETATLQHWKKYALKLTAFAAAALLSAHGFAFLFAS